MQNKSIKYTFKIKEQINIMQQNIKINLNLNCKNKIIKLLM